MRMILPENRVMFDYKETLDAFVVLLRQAQNDNLYSIFIGGSYARGDATDSSDMDLWCIFHQIDGHVLDDVGGVVRRLSGLQPSPKINPQCLSLAEFKSEPFANWVERPGQVLGAVHLYGADLIGNEVTVTEIESLLQRHLVDIVLSIRHYISVDEPVEKLTYAKIRTYVLKPLMLALRLERWCTCGSYPLSNDDLKNACAGEAAEVVEYFLNPGNLEAALQHDHSAILQQLHDITVMLLRVTSSGEYK